MTRYLETSGEEDVTAAHLTASEAPGPAVQVAIQSVGPVGTAVEMGAAYGAVWALVMSSPNMPRLPWKTVAIARRGGPAAPRLRTPGPVL
jgi:hypothetical protein